MCDFISTVIGLLCGQYVFMSKWSYTESVTLATRLTRDHELEAKNVVPPCENCMILALYFITINYLPLYLLYLLYFLLK